ncbi:MAG: T9SS type A sorting domain-containing protein [Bacteroidetes bacterium]|nr:T9SS type A sorting domain-containing protein [Bacteroidota bacterium]
MKIKTIASVILLAAITILLSSFGGSENTRSPSGSPSGNTGSPGDGQNCTSCHGGSASAVTGWITSTIPASGYTPGSTYSITVTVTGSGNKGFQVSPQNVAGTLLGTLIAGTGSKLTGSGKYITQSSTSSTNPKIWTFQWIAPAAGTGVVTFYGAFTVSKPVTKLSTLVVNEAAAPLTVTASATPSTINQGQSSQLHATPAGGSGTYTYSWTSNPAGFTSTQQNPNVTPTETTTYSVQVNDGTSNASASTTVTVVIPTPLSVIATANPTSINSGQSSQLSATPGGGSGSYTYLWTSNPSGFISTLQNPTVNPTTTTTYSVQVNDGFTSVSANATVTVLSTLSVTATANPTSIISGQSSQLNATAAGGSGTYTYSWTSSPSGFTSTTQNPTVNPTITTIYTVQVNDGSSMASASATVSVMMPLTVFATATPGTICINQTSQLNTIVSGGSGSYSYAWTSNPPGFTSAISNPVVSPLQSTTYFITVFDGTSTRNESVVVTVKENATAFAGNDTTWNLYAPGIQLNGFATNYSSVSWATSGDGTFNNNGILNATYFPGTNDKIIKTFNLTLTANAISPCTSNISDVVKIELDPATQIIDFGKGSGFLVFPNPAHEIMMVSVHGKDQTSLELTLFDNTGRVVIHSTVTCTGKSIYPVEISHLAKGIYFLQVKSNSSTGIQKVIIE